MKLLYSRSRFHLGYKERIKTGIRPTNHKLSISYHSVNNDNENTPNQFQSGLNNRNKHANKFNTDVKIYCCFEQGTRHWHVYLLQ